MRDFIHSSSCWLAKSKRFRPTENRGTTRAAVELWNPKFRSGGMFMSRLPMTELTMRRLNRSAASPDVPAANLAWHQAAGEHRRIPGIKFADQRGGHGLQCHPGLVRIVCRVFCGFFSSRTFANGRGRARKRMGVSYAYICERCFYIFEKFAKSYFEPLEAHPRNGRVSIHAYI